MKLWPRLPRKIAEKRFAELGDLSIEELRDRSDVTDPSQTFASTGGDRVSTQELFDVRIMIVDLAKQHGYPSSLVNSIGFDRALAPELHVRMRMAIGEALNRDVWSFASLVLAPDVTSWRFGNATEERWVCVDRTRHMYSRLWWQQNQLGAEAPDGGTLLDHFTESELNQVLERTSIGGCKPLVEAFGRALLTLPDDVPRRALVRNSALHLLRLSTLIDPHAAAADELDSIVEMAVSQALAAVPQD